MFTRMTPTKKDSWFFFFYSERALEELDWLIEFDVSFNKLTMLPPTILRHLSGVKQIDLSNNDLGIFLEGKRASSIDFPENL